LSIAPTKLAFAQTAEFRLKSEKKPFRSALETNGFYAEWKKRYGDAAWSILEKYSGSLV
jgi:hypothetical protein